MRMSYPSTAAARDHARASHRLPRSPPRALIPGPTGPLSELTTPVLIRTTSRTTATSRLGRRSRPRWGWRKRSASEQQRQHRRCHLLPGPMCPLSELTTPVLIRTTSRTTATSRLRRRSRPRWGWRRRSASEQQRQHRRCLLGAAAALRRWWRGCAKGLPRCAARRHACPPACSTPAGSASATQLRP